LVVQQQKIKVEIKNIIFDLGGVLLNLDFVSSRKAFIKLGVPQFDELFRITHEDNFWKQYEIGRLNDMEFVAEARRLAVAGTSEKDIIDAWNSMLLDFPQERVDLLDRLKNKYRLFLFSNTNSIHVESFRKTFRAVYNREIDSLFEKAWYSNVINLRKPEVAAFQYVVKNSGINAAETLFIDDSLPNVEGARAAGLQARHLEPGMTVLDLGLETISP
jgi:FMN phosphatase YigB (HAD superfamily)